MHHDRDCWLSNAKGLIDTDTMLVTGIPTYIERVGPRSQLVDR